MKHRPRVVAVDPGTHKSGLVVLDLDIPSGPVVHHSTPANDDLLALLASRSLYDTGDLTGNHVLVLEMIASQGMAVGAETFETCVWIGRFMEAWGGPAHRVLRGEVKIHLCGSMRAKDPNIRAALLDRYGGESAALARPRKCEPCRGRGEIRVGRGKERIATGCASCRGSGKVGAFGPLHGIASHEWAALAVGLTWAETKGGAA